MNIKIWDDKYIIRADKYQYRLIEIKQKATEEELEDAKQTDDGTYEVIVGYYPTLRYLFQNLVEIEGRQNRCATMEGYIKHIEKINAQLENILNNIQSIVGVEKSLNRILNSRGDELPVSAAELDGVDEKPKHGRKKKG